MKLVFAVGAYHPSCGGVQMVAKYLAEGLVNRGHEVCVLTQLCAGTLREEVYCGVRILRFKEKKWFKWSVGEKQPYQKQLIEECHVSDALLVFCANNFVAKWAYGIMDKLNCRKILFQHGMYDGKFHLDKIHSFQRGIKQVLLTIYWETFHRLHWRQIQKFEGCMHLFYHDSSYDYFTARGFEHNYVLINSCENTFFKKETPQAEVLERYKIQNPYFIYVANMCSRKNQLRAVKSFLDSDCTEVELVLIGSRENAYAKKVQEHIKQAEAEGGRKKNKAEKVHVLLGISRSDTVQLIRQSFACFMTSENEYLPITILESMACGRPFISTDVGVVGKVPGGNVCRNQDDLLYWLRYYETHPQYVEQMGQVAAKYARENCYLDDKLLQLENILSGSVDENSMVM